MVTAPTQDKLADYFELRGTLAVDLAKANSGDTLYAEPGKYFVLTVNPASHYALVTNSLTASYDISYRAVQEAKFGSGKYYTYDAQSDTFREATVEQGAAIPEDTTYYKEASERVTEQITPSDTGVYMVRVPVTAARGGAKVITLNAGFALENSTTVPTDRTSTPQNQGSAASSQLAGALAVGVNINDNDASVTTTGTVTAGGTVTVKAEGSYASVVKADGSPVEKPEEPTPGPETGGQEIPETTPEQFQQTLEKIREDISRTPIEAGSPHLLSVSIGGVYGVPNLTDAIRQADQLMYLAKQQKNQVQYRIIMGGREK